MTTTPPTDPTYNVHFSPAKIHRILDRVFLKRHLASINQLETGKSFNNRIYFIKLAPSADHAEKGLVLKVSGRFYGPTKVHNEVASLCLLEQFCRDVPAPRVLAWCDDGTEGGDINIIRRPNHQDMNEHAHIETCAHPSNDSGSSERGWILMSRLVGRVLERSDVESQHRDRIMKDLASILSQMRQGMPVADHIGNLTLYDNTLAATKNFSYCSLFGGKLGVGIEGLASSPHSSNQPICSASEYYTVRLRNQLAKLNEQEVLSSSRARIAATVDAFMGEEYPKMQLLIQINHPTFTHYDFSPRNVIIAGSPPTITGIMDFEFAGFFPPEEEFANNVVENEDDWPADAYEILLQELERLGVATPLRRFPKAVWKEAELVMKLIEDTAPWYLLQGETDTGKLQPEWQEAANRVTLHVESLRRLQTAEN